MKWAPRECKIEDETDTKNNTNERNKEEDQISICIRTMRVMSSMLDKSINMLF